MSGKGDKRRKQDLKKYRDNYDKIFKKKFDFTGAVKSLKDGGPKNKTKKTKESS